MLVCCPSPWAVLHSCTTVTGSIQGYRFACRQPLLPPHFTVKLPNQDPSLSDPCHPPTHLLQVLLNSRAAVIGPSPHHSLLCVIIPSPPIHLTLHSALFPTWAPRQAGRLLSFSSFCPSLDILDTASIPAVLTRRTGRHDSEARLRASGGDVTPAHHQGDTHYQLAEAQKNSWLCSRCASTTWQTFCLSVYPSPAPASLTPGILSSWLWLARINWAVYSVEKALPPAAANTPLDDDILIGLQLHLGFCWETTLIILGNW